MCKKVGEECLFLQLQGLSTRSGLSEGEAYDEAPLSQQQLRELGWFSCSSSPLWGKIMESQHQFIQVWSELLLLFPRTPQHFYWNKSSQAGSTTSLCALCDSSSLTCAACSGKAEQPCPPRSVLITRGSSAV